MTGSGADVGDESSSAGVWLGGALLTGVTPCSTNGGATQCFGANDPTDLALAHLVVDLGETGSSPVVCGSKQTCYILLLLHSFSVIHMTGG